jgi:hypothetical protein
MNAPKVASAIVMVVSLLELSSSVVNPVAYWLIFLFSVFIGILVSIALDQLPWKDASHVTFILGIMISFGVLLFITYLLPLPEDFFLNISPVTAKMRTIIGLFVGGSAHHFRPSSNSD